MAAHGTEEWKIVLSEVITTAYAAIVEPLNLQSDTEQQLNERFTSPGGVNGDSRTKAVRFYLAALSECGISFSPHFKKGAASSASGAPAAKATNGPPKRRKSKAKVDGNGTIAAEPAPTAGTRQLTVSLPTRDVKVWLPVDLDNEELAFVILQLQGFLKLAQRPKAA